MYIPLARKYRPETFSDLVGQDDVCRALVNSIKLNRQPQGVILTGVRGTGKTTTARLYAKALNCLEPNERGPCGKCDSCCAIRDGVHEDVLEIDGASNTGVDDVRRLIDSVQYVAQRSKFKVYIIDEVHMLSTNAFNALLKTLEEPPSHVVFVFATTELGKVPETVASRCQVFYLKKFQQTQIEDNLKNILTKENLPFEDQAVSAIAAYGRGSMRDAITFLDHVVALGEGKVHSDVVDQLTGRLKDTELLSFLKFLIHKDAMSLLQWIEKSDIRGIEAKNLCEQLLAMTRQCLVEQVKSQNPAASRGRSGESEGHFSEISSSSLPLLKDILSSVQPFDLNRIYRTLRKSYSDLDGSMLDRFTLENYCIEWCFDPGLPGHKASKHSKREESKSASEPVFIPPAPTPNQVMDSSKVQQNATTPNETEVSPSKSQSFDLKSRIQAMSGEGSKKKHLSPQDKVEVQSYWKNLTTKVNESRPLFGRLLEEIYCVVDQAEHLSLKIKLDMPSSKFLHDVPLLVAHLKEFGFVGKLEVGEWNNNVTCPSQDNQVPTPVRAHSSDRASILDQKREDAIAKDLREWNSLKASPAAQSIVGKWGGRLVEVPADSI